jgi:methionyl-tRNA synthetase
VTVGAARTTIVFTPPPTPNGPLHVGHVGGPYLRADLWIRLARMFTGSTYLHVSHVDTYQTYVAKKAVELREEPLALARRNRDAIRADFTAYALEQDHFGDNEDLDYLRFLREGVRAFESSAVLARRSVPACGDCGTAMLEAFARTPCPHCLHDAYLNVCENCSAPQHTTESAALRCSRCGGGPGASTEARFLRLGAEDVAAVSLAVGHRHGASRRAAGLLSRLATHDVLWSFPAPYGIAVDESDEVLNPWVEIFFHHLWCLLGASGVDRSLPFDEAVRQVNSRDIRVVYFFGVDNTYYYTFLFTAMALRLDITAMLPEALKINHFMQLNGAKMSSSRGNALWAHELTGTAPVEELRTRLARSCPEYSVRDLAPATAAPLRSPRRSGGAPTGDSGAWQVATLRRRLEELAAIEAFSVESLLDALDKGREHADLVEGPVADQIRRYLDEVCGTLRLA